MHHNDRCRRCGLLIVNGVVINQHVEPVYGRKYCMQCVRGILAEWEERMEEPIGYERESSRTPPAPEPIRRAFERYQHLDGTLSDVAWMHTEEDKEGRFFIYHICHELWMAIRETAK